MCDFVWEKQLESEYVVLKALSSAQFKDVDESLVKAFILSERLERHLTIAGKYWDGRSEADAWSVYLELLCRNPVKCSETLMEFTPHLPPATRFLAAEICQLLLATVEVQRNSFESFRSFICTVFVAVTALRQLLDRALVGADTSTPIMTASDNFAEDFAVNCLETLPIQIRTVAQIPLSEAADIIAREIHRRLMQ